MSMFIIVIGLIWTKMSSRFGSCSLTRATVRQPRASSSSVHSDSGNGAKSVERTGRAPKLSKTLSSVSLTLSSLLTTPP